MVRGCLPEISVIFSHRGHEGSRREGLKWRTERFKMV